jgi:retinol dehydrogenase 12
LLFPPEFGAYTELYAGLSKDLGDLNKDQGIYIVPWGRKASVRADLYQAIKDGGTASKLYDWCEANAAKYT